MEGVETSCSQCLTTRCCDAHCCDYEDCDCGDCEMCGGTLPLEWTALEIQERDDAKQRESERLEREAAAHAELERAAREKSDSGDGKGASEAEPEVKKGPSLREIIAEQTARSRALTEELRELTSQFRAVAEERETLSRQMQEAHQGVIATSQRVTEAKNELTAAEKDLENANVEIHLALREVSGQVTLTRGDLTGLGDGSGQTDARITETCQALNDHYYHVIDNFWTPPNAHTLRSQMVRASTGWGPGQLAGGRDGTNLKYTASHVRGDLIEWATSKSESLPALREYSEFVDEFVRQLSLNCDELKDKIVQRGAIMATKYPGNGAAYVRHIDNPNQNGRVLTALLYLNPRWKAGDGGQLRIYHPTSPHDPAESHTDVDPLFNRLVVFLCDQRVPHEVLAAYDDRFAVTIWYSDTRETLRAKESGKDSASRQRTEDRIREEMKSLSVA